MAVLSVDLAYRHWSNLGVVVLERKLDLSTEQALPALRWIARQLLDAELQGTAVPA